MKKSFIALAVLGAFAGAASAQSNVEVYGGINLGLVKQTGLKTQMVDGADIGSGSSRIGFRGVEDLGGGLKAGFVVETDFAADHVQATRFGQRNSYIDLMGSFGTVRMGRHLNPANYQVGAFHAFGTDYGNASASKILANEGARYNNAISYLTPNFSGFTAQVTVATSEADSFTAGAGNATNRTPKAFRIAYGAGPIKAGFAYSKDGPSGTDNVIQLGGSYDFGMATVMATWEDNNNQVDGNAYAVGARIPVGAFGIRASFGKDDTSAQFGATDVKQYGIGFDYALSKRTGVYGVYNRVNGTGLAKTSQIILGLGHNF